MTDDPSRLVAADGSAGACLGPYQLLGVLGKGSSAVVHRGRHLGSGELAAVKRLHVDDPADLAGLRQEIEILGRLRHPGVVRVLAHGLDAGTPWYAMELVEGRSLEAIWAAAGGGTPSEAEVRTSLRVLQRLAVTLSFIHGEGLVHRDLKPANVIVGAGEWPVLVDFGFAARFAARTGREVLEPGGDVIGSLAYMAPEQVRGEFVDARADLYALGCMLYEAVTGASPFVGLPWQVANAHLDTAPAPPQARGARIGAALEQLILALLAKQPSQRPGFAVDVAEQLGSVTGEPVVTTADPYLYRAGLVGRDTALAHLAACLERAAEGNLCCALIAGESGVGKTRLAMEFTRLAVQRRFLVGVGECLPADSGGGGALAALRPVMRRLADACRQSGPRLTQRLVGGGRAGVLATVEPTFAALPGLEREPPPAPLPAAAGRDRLVETLVAALGAWAVETPLVIVLDDLQWADELTLATLGGLVDAAPSSPLCVLGTLRSEEESGALYGLAARPGVTRIALGRVDRDAVGTIVADMLAVPQAPPMLVDFLADQSEGNPFFVSEYLRTAVGAGLLVRTLASGWQPRAEDLGSYSALGLPRTLRDLVERRLRDLGAGSQALLGAAAVLGREFDPVLAAELVHLDATQHVAALGELRARQVADMGAGGRWRFAHDKLREVAYAVLDPAQRRVLHGAAAAALEARLGETKRNGEDYATIALHLDAAGEPQRAATYHARAGEYAVTGGALDAARVHLTTALHAAPATTPLRQRAHWWRQLAEATSGTDLATAISATGNALQALGERVPTSLAGWGLLICAQLVRRLHPRPARDPEMASEAAQASNRAATSFYFQFEILQGVASSLRCINLADAAGEPGRGALAYAQLGYVAGGARLHRLAARCFTRAHALRDASVDPSEFAAGLYFHAMYEMGFGRWVESQALGNEAVERLRAIGNHQEAEVAATVLANTLYFGGELRAAEACAAGVQASADRRGHAQHGAWGLFLRGRSHLALGDITRARDLIERGYAQLLPTRDFVSLVMCEGLLAKVRWFDGDAAGAARAADAIDARLAERRMVPLAQCLDGYGALADVRLRLWAAHDDPTSAAAARRACRTLRRFARLYPIAAPAAARAAARHAWRLGQATRARRAWLRSARLAAALRMPFDEAGARLDLARATGDVAQEARGVAQLAALGCAPATAQHEGFA